MSGVAPHEDSLGLYSHYEGYRSPTNSRLREVLSQGLVALDTNVLLDLYRYGAKARLEFFEVLEKVENSIFIPAQVLREFWRNRVSVLEDIVSLSAVTELRKTESSVQGILNRWSSRTQADTEADEVMKHFAEAFDNAVATVTSVEKDFNVADALRDTNLDPVLQRLESLLEGKVGRPAPPDTLHSWIVEGNERFASLVPPGYKDAEKHGQAEEGTGDYILWKQLLLEAGQKQKDVILITRDLKEDWWRFDKQRQALGPRVELTDEMRKVAAVDFFLLQPKRFLAMAPTLLDVTVSPSTVEDVSRISAADTRADDSLWTMEAAEWLLDMLTEEGWQAQVGAIRAAARTPDRFVTREEVFRIGGYDEDRLLKGFTRPVKRLTEEMISQGLLGEDVEAALETSYDGPGRARGFYTPSSLAAAISQLEARAGLTWLEAARLVMEESSEWWSVDDILRAILAQGLRDVSRAQTPHKTLARDLQLRGNDMFERDNGRYRLKVLTSDSSDRRDLSVIPDD